MPETNENVLKQMENAIEAVARDAVQPPRQSQAQALRPSAPNLDAARLVELARDRLVFARNRLTEVRRDHQMKRFEIDNHYQQRLDEARREREEALVRLEQQTAAAQKPAEEMIALVERLLG
jgi:hypothetical protein